MCMITTLSPMSVEKEEFNYDYLKNAYNHNKDGCGFSFITNKGKLRIIKGLYEIDTFIGMLKKARKSNPDSYFLIHQRNATKGLIDKTNCHPFHLGYCVMAHNGTFGEFSTSKFSTESDSIKFAEFVKGMPSKWYEKQVYIDLLDDFCGNLNRAAFLFPDNSIIYIGSTKWVELNEDVVFSNDYYKKPVSNVITANFNDKEMCCVCKKEKGTITINNKNYCENCLPEDSEDTKIWPVKCKMCDKELTTEEEKKDGFCSVCREDFTDVTTKG